MTVILRGDARSQASAKAALAADPELPVELQFAELPNQPRSAAGRAPGEIEARLAASRQKYIAADFPGCLRGISSESLVPHLLGEGRRDLAARVVFWRVACQVGFGAPAEAQRDARELAALGLEIPPDVGASTPEVEATLARAVREAAAAPRFAVDVTADVGAATVSVDGRPGICTTPCVVEAPPGNHVLRVEADGLLPTIRIVRVETGRTRAAFETTAAPPEVAAQQWLSRYAASPAIDSAPSVRLLSRAIRARRLVLLTTEGAATHSGDLRAVLAVDGAVAARAERSGSVGEGQARALLRELLVSGKVLEPAPSLWRRPLFWVALGLVAAGTATGTVLLLYRPAPQVQVGF